VGRLYSFARLQSRQAGQQDGRAGREPSTHIASWLAGVFHEKQSIACCAAGRGVEKQTPCNQGDCTAIVVTHPHFPHICPPWRHICCSKSYDAFIYHTCKPTEARARGRRRKKSKQKRGAWCERKLIKIPNLGMCLIKPAIVGDAYFIVGRSEKVRNK